MKTKIILSVYLCSFILGILIGSFGFIYKTLPHNEKLVVSDEAFYSLNAEEKVSALTNTQVVDGSVSVHFLELGNKYTGDCTYIKVNENIDILIDCGSRSNSIEYIESYLNKYVTDNILEYVIITHAHQDHYAGFATTTKVKSIFDLYKCENIIYFSQITNGKDDSNMYKNFIRELSEAKNSLNEEPNKRTALECINNTPSFVLDAENNISLRILDSYYYANRSSNENEHSVCCMISHGNRDFMFTGDLESDGEEELINKNPLIFTPDFKVEVLKAGHHGSKTSSSDTFLSQILTPESIVCVCCCAGSSEYTANIANQFPTKDFIDRVSKYTIYVYVTTMCLNYKNDEYEALNGNIVVSSASSITVNCSNNDKVLKDTEWFKTNRYELCKDSMDNSWK